MKSRAGFSLIEIALALAIIATIGVALVGVLGSGLNVTRQSLADAETMMLVENVQARLTLDPAWPGERKEIFISDSGDELPGDKKEQAAFRVVPKKIAGPGFSSKYFETFRMAIERMPQGREIGAWTLQRARLAKGEPVAAP